MTERPYSIPEFTNRRRGTSPDDSNGQERRQFGNSHANLSPGAQEIGNAIDRYKLEHRRRFVTYDEIYEIITRLGYRKAAD